jgi:hypothetical protein
MARNAMMVYLVVFDRASNESSLRNDKASSWKTDPNLSCCPSL